MNFPQIVKLVLLYYLLLLGVGVVVLVVEVGAAVGHSRLRHF